MMLYATGDEQGYRQSQINMVSYTYNECSFAPETAVNQDCYTNIPQNQKAFHRAHHQVYDHSDEQAEVQIVSVL